MAVPLSSMTASSHMCCHHHKASVSSQPLARASDTKDDRVFLTCIQTMMPKAQRKWIEPADTETAFVGLPVSGFLLNTFLFLSLPSSRLCTLLRYCRDTCPEDCSHDYQKSVQILCDKRQTLNLEQKQACQRLHRISLLESRQDHTMGCKIKSND